MHDINFIRKNPIEFDNSIKKRGENPLSTQILKVDEEKTITDRKSSSRYVELR